MALRRLLPCLLLLLAAAPATASAVGWSTLGGGPGRAGHDAFDHGATTNVVASWSQTAAAEQNVVAGPVISDGFPGTQRVVYGTDAGSGTDPGSVHVQMLSTGMEVGLQEGHNIDDGSDEGDTFGDVDAVISPVIASSPSAPGQVYVLHNDDQVGPDDDIALAQVDLATGALVQDLPVPETDGYTLHSSPVLTEPDAGGDASLFFVADGATDRLFRLDIADVLTSSASFAAASSWITVQANTRASPTLVYLRDAAGVPTLYVAVGTNGINFLETYAVADFTPGPEPSPIGTAAGQTPSVPLTSDGLLPGAPGSGLDTSPWIYMATEETAGNRVHRLEQFGNDQTLDVVSSVVPLSGVPAHALAVSKRVGADPAEGVVAYTTSENLYLLNPGDLGLRAAYSPTTAPNDFGTTTAALSDELVFAMLADGTQLVLRTSNANKVSSAEFTQDPANAPSTAKGQPALAGGRVVFPSDQGAFAYITTDATPPRVGQLGPASVLGGGILEAAAVDARGIRDVQFLIDGTPVATSTNPVSGLSHTPSGGRFIAGWDAGGTAPGPHTLEAIATDNGGQRSVARATIVVQPHTPFADTDPPETAIESGPRRRTPDTTPRFRFSSNERPEAFECSLDGGRFRSCPARHALALVAGRHRLRVRAVDAAGNVDPTPSVASFTVLAPGPVEVAALRPIELRRGAVAVPVTCHSRRRCRGVLVLHALVPRAGAASVEAIASRKGRKLRVGRTRFSVGPRTRRKVLVRVSSAGRRLLNRHDRLNVTATVKLNTPAGVERSAWPLKLVSGDS